MSEEALALARPSGDPVAMRDALSARLWASLGPDAIDERLAVGRELLALGEREQSLLLTMLAHDAAFGAHLLRGDLEAATRALAAYGEAATALKRPAFVFLATYWRGSLALARGEIDAAETCFRAALARGRGTGPVRALHVPPGRMYPLRYLRGEDDDPELAAIFFGEMIALPYSFEPAIRTSLAFVGWLRGDRGEAEREFERVAVRVEQGLERDEHWLMTVGGLSRLAILLGDTARAASLYDRLLPYADLMLVHDQLRAVGEPVAAMLGALDAFLGRFDAGVAHYEHAMAKATAMGVRIALIDVHAGYARLLEARGDAASAAAPRSSEMRRPGPWPRSASVATGCSTRGPRVGAHARRRDSREAGGRRPRRSRPARGSSPSSGATSAPTARPASPPCGQACDHANGATEREGPAGVHRRSGRFTCDDVLPFRQAAPPQSREGLADAMTAAPAQGNVPEPVRHMLAAIAPRRIGRNSPQIRQDFFAARPTVGASKGGSPCVTT